MTTSKRSSKSTGNPIPVFRRNILQRPVSGLLVIGFGFLFAGCGPKYTYLSHQVPQAVEQIAREEYQMAVRAKVEGKTAGAMVYVPRLVDSKGALHREVQERLGRLMQVLTRVTLATDLPLDFCQAVVRDRHSGNELRMTRYVDDIKRANVEAIGVEESINRTVITQNRYTRPGAPEKGSLVSNPELVVRDIVLPDFLAEQIAQRIRFGLARQSKLEADETSQPFILVDGHFEAGPPARVLRFSVMNLQASTDDDPHATILKVLKITNDVVWGYRFNGFDRVEIQDYLNRLKLVINQKTLMDFQQKRITAEEILDQYLVESQSVQEAFKLFGFTLPQE